MSGLPTDHPAYWPTYQAVLMAAATDLYRTRGRHADGYLDAISDCIGDAMAAAEEAVSGFEAQAGFDEDLAEAVERSTNRTRLASKGEP